MTSANKTTNKTYNEKSFLLFKMLSVMLCRYSQQLIIYISYFLKLPLTPLILQECIPKFVWSVFIACSGKSSLEQPENTVIKTLWQGSTQTKNSKTKWSFQGSSSAQILAWDVFIYMLWILGDVQKIHIILQGPQWSKLQQCPCFHIKGEAK